MIQNKLIKVLIVTQNSEEVDLITSALQSNGADVMIATDCLDALLKIFETESNVILLTEDMQNSSAVCTQLHNLSGIPVILLGDDSSKKAWQRAIELGAEGYFNKTIGQNELIARLKAILRRYN
ncbi:MAG: response regulator [Chloroflexi bacterium]|nr:response regulator [Chloroflexota bacterium]